MPTDPTNAGEAGEDVTNDALIMHVRSVHPIPASLTLELCDRLEAAGKQAEEAEEAEDKASDWQARYEAERDRHEATAEKLEEARELISDLNGELEDRNAFGKAAGREGWGQE